MDKFGLFAIAGDEFVVEGKKPFEEFDYGEIIPFEVPKLVAYVVLTWALLLAVVLVLIIYLLIVKKPKSFGEK